MTHSNHRRLFGLVLGTLTGLSFCLVMQNINRLVLPGIPFYQPPFGPAWNVVMGTVLGAALGFITAWAETGVKGVFLGSFTGALVLGIATLLSGPTGPEVWLDKIVSVIIIFVPTAAMMVPVLALFRWLVNREEDAYREVVWPTTFLTTAPKPPAFIPRVVLPVLLVLFAGAAGLTTMYNDLARTVTPRMFAMLEEARLAESAAGLPEPLRVDETRDFFNYARQPYSLQWDKDDGNKFAIPRPNTSQFDQSTVIARYQNGYMLACMYPDPTEYPPHCKGFSPNAR